MTNDKQPDVHPLSGTHINQGSMDAAADAYEAEYNAAHQPAAVDGWKLVPVEPTPEMLEAGKHIKRMRLLETVKYHANGGTDILPDSYGLGEGAEYRAMLSAAPTPPSAPVQQSVREAFDQTEGKEIFAWAEFDGEGGYDLRLYEDNEEYRDEYIARNGEKYSDWVMPLYTHPKPPQPDSNELVEALKLAKDTINVLWVSHHANRADAAISAIDAALAQSPSVGLNTKKGG